MKPLIHDLGTKRALRYAAVFGALLGAQACAVQAVDSETSADAVVNSCQRDSDCGSGALCGPGICVASHGDLSSVLVAVVPPATALYGAGDSFLVALDDVATGFSRDLALPWYARVKGRVTTELSNGELCSASYDAQAKSIGVHVELTRSEATWGLPAATYEANSQPVADGWEFEVPVPSGVYDIYVSPQPDCASEFPPVLVRTVTLEATGTSSDDLRDEIHYALNIGKPAEIHGTVKLPELAPNLLDGWTVSLLEPRQGRLISTTHTWGPQDGPEFVLRYHQLEGGDPPLVKVTPPEGMIAPSLLWDLSVLDLGGNGQIGLDLQAVVLKTVNVRAQVVHDDASPEQIVGVPGATMRLRSLALDGVVGLSAWFETTATADATGSVQVDLLPGRYRAVVIPPDETNMAMTTDEWVVAGEPAKQAGRTVGVKVRPTLAGTVVDPLQNQPLESMTVSIAPSGQAPQSYLERTISPPGPTPRPGSGFTDATGGFDIAVDPGSFDLSVQPRSDQALPWLVRSRLKVPNEGLGEMLVTFPVPLSGVLRDPNGDEVQQALLRVYAPLDDAGGTTTAPSLNAPGIEGLLQVAEARTDKNGRFRILLPATIR